MKKLNDMEEGNTNVSIRDYFDSKYKELKEYIDVKFNAMEKSTSLAQENLNTRLEGMNEFRNTLKDQSSHFITRTEHKSLIDKYDADIRVLRENLARNEGKASQQSVNTAFIIATLGIVIGIVGIIIKFI
jgi:hypothetical protein